MKQLDTDTVLEIIKMLDTRIDKIRKCQLVVDEQDDKAYFKGKEDLAIYLRDHLQDYIEGQLNALETQSPEQ